MPMSADWSATGVVVFIIGVGGAIGWFVLVMLRKIQDYMEPSNDSAYYKVLDAYEDPSKKVLKLDGHGWLQIRDGNKAQIVPQIKRVPGLVYDYVRRKDDYDGVEEYVIVSSEIGDVIELYVRGDGYAGLSVDEFIAKTIMSGFSGKNG